MAVARILSEKYVTHTIGVPFKTLVFGYQGTVERLIQVRCVSLGHNTPAATLLGIEPTAQEFNKHGVYNQVGFSSLINFMNVQS